MLQFQVHYSNADCKSIIDIILMSYPSNICPYDLYFDPVYLSGDSELSYMLSFEDLKISEKSIHFSPKDTFESPLESYNFVDFTNEAYDKLLGQTKQELRVRSHDITKAIRSGFKEFFMRSASKTLESCLRNINYDFLAQCDNLFNKTSILEQIKNDFKLDSMKGNIPAKWPDGLRDFLKDLDAMPINAFSSEAEHIMQQFLIRIQACLKTAINKCSPEDILLILRAYLGLSFRTTNYTIILASLSFVQSISDSLPQDLLAGLVSELSALLASVRALPSKPRLQHLSHTGMMGGFGIMKKLLFQKQNFYYNSLTTDGQYLYLIVSCPNGGMFKIGTGENSIAGKVYLHVNTNKSDQVAWVWVKGKLYLRSSSKESRNLDIIDPETFKIEGCLQLHCPALFGHVIVQNINKNNPLLSDGEHLYIIGKRLTTEKLPDPPKPQKEKEKEKAESPKEQALPIVLPPVNSAPVPAPPPVPAANPLPPVPPKSPEQLQKEKKKKEKLIKKKDKKKNAPEPQNILKLVEYVLYEFDVTNSSVSDQGEQQHDSELVKELYESFSRYFTVNQCRKALNLHRDDMANAAQWLVDEGDKQRTKRTHSVVRSVVLAQAEVTNDPHQKPLKSAGEIATKQDSILHATNISEHIWTCSKDQVACYTENGIRVFSKYEKDYKHIHVKQDPHSEDRKYRLHGTYLGTVNEAEKTDRNRKFNKVPEYLITYDNFNNKYYTFNWVESDHTFPTLISVSRDLQNYEQQTGKQHPPVELPPAKNFSDLVMVVLNSFLSLESHRFEQDFMPSNPLYTLSCLVLDLNTKIAAAKQEQPDLKKKLTMKRNKVVAKMNKVMEMMDRRERPQLTAFGKSAREVRPEYAYCINGRIETLRMLDAIFHEKPEYSQLYYTLLDLWVMNADLLIFDHHEYLASFGAKLLERFKKTEGSVSDQLLRILSKGFFIFLPTQQLQYQFILSLVNIELVDLVDIHFRPFSNHSILRQSYVEQLSADQVVGKLENNFNYSNLFHKKQYLDLPHSLQVNNIGNLLLDSMEHTTNFKATSLRDLQYIRSRVPGNKALKTQLLEKITKGLQQESEETLILYQTLLVEAVKYLKKFHDEKFEYQQLPILVTDAIRVLEQVLPKVQPRNQGPLLKLASFVIQVYFASPCSLCPSQNILATLTSFLSTLLAPSDISAVLNSLPFRIEGISQTHQNIFQTNHPYERDRKQIFEPQHYNSIFITVEFDKRCQSDPNYDFLTINSWGTNQPAKDIGSSNFNTQLKMTGKINSKKPYLMLGSSITMEFASSGNARDVHSLNRYGFRVGARPAYSGRVEVDKNTLAEVTAKFGTQENFELYVNLLKLVAVTSSALIENILLESKDSKEEQLGTYLEGKIFSQGLEDESNRNQPSAVDENVAGIEKLLKLDQHKDRYNTILNEIYQSNVVRCNEDKPAEELKAIPPQPVVGELWDLTGIPAHIRPYIQQIKNYSGNFITLFIEARSHVKDSRLYTAQAMRNTFTGQYKKLWMMGQALLFLTVLKHSGLLQLSLSFSIEYIKANLQAFEEARNKTIDYLINRMQTVRKWHEYVDIYHSKDEQAKEEEKEVKQLKGKEKDSKVVIKKTGKKITVKMEDKKVEKKDDDKKEKKVKFNPEVAIREVLTDPVTIKRLCQFKGLPYVQNQTYANVTQILTKLKTQAISTQSFYEQPALHLIRSCLFLLRLKSCNNHEQPLANLKPPINTRSLSEGQQHIDKNKVVLFREWLENWKKWKGFKKEEKVELKFPVKEIVEFIKGWVDNAKVTDLIRRRQRRANKRLEMLELLNTLTKTVQGNFVLERYVLGILTANLSHGLVYKLQGASEDAITSLKKSGDEYQQTLNSISEANMKHLPLTILCFNNELKQSPMLPKLKALAMHNLLLFCDMVAPPLDVALYYLSFKQMSNTNEQMVLLSSFIANKNLIAQHSLQQLVGSLWREIGKDTLSMRRWKDVVFIERLRFLMLKLEIIQRKDELDFQHKEKLAQVLFYLAYHIEAPMINKVSLRMIRKLDLGRKANKLQTPFDVEYINMKEKEVVGKVKSLVPVAYTHKVENPLGNWELLTKRCGENFFCQRQPIKSELLPKKPLENKIHMILHLTSEQDIGWLINVLYYIEQISPTLKPIASFEDYLAEKARKDEHKNDKKQPQPVPVNQPVQVLQQPMSLHQQSQQQKIEQKLLQNIPDCIALPKQIEDKLPVGWFLSYNNSFHEFRSVKQEALKQKTTVSALPKPQPNPPGRKGGPMQKKPWQAPILTRLMKKYEELSNKPLEEPKEADPADQKQEFVKAKNFIARMKKHTTDAFNAMIHLSANGFMHFIESENMQRIEMLCQLIEFGKQNRLQPIPCEFSKKDYKTKLAPGDISAPDFSQLRIQFVQSSFYPTLQFMLEAVESTAKENSFMEANRSEVVFRDNQQMSWEEIRPLAVSDIEPEAGNMKTGKELIESGWFHQKKKLHQVFLRDFDAPEYSIVQGGVGGGIRKCVIVSNNDVNMTSQSVSLDNIVAKNVVAKFTDREQITEELCKVLQSKLPQVTSIENCQPYIELKCLLSKASTIDWTFSDNKEEIKELVNKLMGICKLTTTQKTVKQYEYELQGLMTKLREKSVEGLQIITFYDRVFNINPTVEKYLVAQPSKTAAVELQPKVETLSTHCLPAPSYLSHIETKPPPIEENKLLKYWEKNILPRIEEFVKTSFKPLEIEEFFEQMRIPLRKYDQTEATKVAYVICQSKLPPGAVLLDANHDWDTLSLEQAAVGRYCLLKLPKTIAQTSTPLLHVPNAEQLCLVQIVFVDVKTNSVLVRRRVQTHSVIHYLWVPLSSTLPVQTPISKTSLAEVYRAAQECLSGLVCGYSKILLTRLSEIVEVDSIGLIRENIQDRFVKDPVRGWMADHKDWSIQPLIQKMLKEGNLKIIDMIEGELKPFKAYDCDLFSNELRKLNIFGNVSSLIVGFKNTSKLSMCSGIKFYNDELMLNQVGHVYAGKHELSHFEPIVFNEPNIYSKFYTNIECLPGYQQNVSPSKVDVTVYGIEPIWTIACFLAERISEIGYQTSSYLPAISRLNSVFVDWILTPGCFVLRSIAASLIVRMTNRLVHIAKKTGVTITPQLLGVTKEKLQRLAQIVKEVDCEQSKELIQLYSTFLQSLSEALANLLTPLQSSLKVECPAFIKSLVDSGVFTRYILRDASKWGDLSLPSPQIPVAANPQWQRFMLIENLPPGLGANEVREKVKKIIAENKGRILTPSLDVYYDNCQLLVLVDQWDVLELVEEEMIEKLEEEKEPEEQQALMVWSCALCTLENSIENEICSVCGARAPVIKPAEVFHKVESADVAAAEQKLREKEAKRFEIVKQQIKEYVTSFWIAERDKVQKENAIIQDKIKQRAEAAKKREERDQKKKRKNKADKEQVKEEELKLLPLPEIPPCNIITGSEIISKPIIENFLAKRLEPCDTNKYLHNVLAKLEGTPTNLEKFKFLEANGFDLWGVHVSDASATLLPYDLLILLMQYVQTQICKQTSSVLSYNPTMIRFISQCHNLKNAQSEEPINFLVENDVGIKVKYKRLAECNAYDLRFSWSVIKALNASLSTSISYIHMGKCKESAFEKNSQCKLNVEATLGEEVCAIRVLIMCSIKSELSQKIMQKTSIMRDQPPKITLQRLKIKEGERKGIVSAKQKDEFITSRAYEQMKLISPTLLRPFKPKGAEPYLSFEVCFKGQNVMGEAGPYRQFFTDITNELHPNRNLGLLMNTPNNTQKNGEGRSKYTVNPSATNSYQLSLFEFIGLLMGCSIRTGAHLALDMPQMFWKQVVGEDVGLNDLEEVDKRLVDYARNLESCPGQVVFAEIEEDDPLYWVATLSDGTKQELIPNGKNIRVTYKDRVKYANKILEARLKESLLQVKCIRKGISQLVPEPFLNYLSGVDLQVLVCGRPRVDVDLLKKHTKYSGGLTQASPRIKYFWAVLHEMTEQQRLKFIKFCWGQQRLPFNSEQFERNNIRFMIKPSLSDSGAPDKSLPRADTCFFNIELPDYSSKEAMRNRILLAINTDCDSMNAEEHIEEHPIMGAESSFEEADYEEGGGGGGMEE